MSTINLNVKLTALFYSTVHIQSGAEERNEEKITLLKLMTTCSVTVGAIAPRVNYRI